MVSLEKLTAGEEMNKNRLLKGGFFFFMSEKSLALLYLAVVLGLNQHRLPWSA